MANYIIISNDYIETRNRFNIKFNVPNAMNIKVNQII